MTQDAPVSAQDRIVSFRTDGDTVARIDAHAERLGAEQPGVKIPRTSAVLNLVLRALDLVEEGK